MLYEVDVQGFKLHTGESAFQYLLDRDVLVPVEPDHEAIAKRVHLPVWMVKAVVDAALKGDT